MKEQYVGDVSDYRKYALLRALTGPEGLKLGVCWMLTPPDGRTDGNKIRYLNEPDKWRSFDPALFDLLKSIVHERPHRRLEAVEESGILHNARFVSGILPDNLSGRSAYFGEAWTQLAEVDLIFFDPDNGLQVSSVRKGRKNSSKYLYDDEVAAAYELGHSLLVYQHFTREERRSLIARISSRLLALAPGTSIRMFLTAHVAFFLVARPDHAPHFSRVIASCGGSWPQDFIECRACSAGF